jgi:hypothetical protein
MYKNLILFVSVLLLSVVSTSQALVIGDFEGGLDGWAPSGDAVLTLSDIGATTGTGSLMIEGPGSWQMLALLDIKSLRSVIGVDGAAVSADVTAFAEDMQTDWMNMEMIINGQNNDDNGANNNIGWQSLGAVDIVRDGAAHTLTWQLPADLSTKIAGTDDSIAWFELFIVTNNGATNTKIYVDNIQLLGAEPEPEPEEPGTKIIYVDATDGETGNTTLATGEVFTATGGNDGTDGLWRPRAFGNSATIFEANGATNGNPNDEIVPRLNTTVQVPENNYDVYVYFWADSSGWRIKASLENADPLPLFIANDPNGGATVAVAEDFAEPVPMLTEGNRTLWQGYLGTTGVTTSISVFIDSDPRPAGDTSWNERTWYDGIGYKIASEPEPAKPKIIYVTSVKDMDKNGTQDDLGWVDWLESEGYEVDARPGYWTDPLDVNDIAELEAADLIIASRGMATDQYDGGETAKWNAITTPIICTNAWMIRTSRWGWMNSNSANKDAGSPVMMVLEPEHPIFKSVPVDQNDLVEVLDPNVASGHTSFLNDIVDAGNGTLLAKTVPGVYDTAWIVEWPAGVEYFEGSGQVAGGPRMLFMAGTQDDPYTVPDGNTAPVGVLNLNESGKQMFLNAVEYMISFVRPVDPGTEGLVAHYAFENDVNDSSGNGLNGTIIGDANFAEGIEGMALDLNGGGYVDCGGIAEFSFTDAMTLSTWVNIRSVTTAWMTIAAKGENAWRLAVSNETTALEYAFSGGTRGWQAATTATELAFDEWYHVAATYDSTVGATVYINGVQDASNPNTGGIDTNQFPLLIGENPEATGRLFDGMIDELMIYNRALSEGEVLYLAGQ